ncbi:MAG: type II toxin-antitoxin system RelE/ParE family toxin [Gallionella sp.]
MIKCFAHKGLEKFFKKGTKAGIQTAHENRLRAQLAKLDSAATPQDMSLPAWKLHPLKGTLKGHWAVSVPGNWRLTFRFDGKDAEIVDYQDYH